ncbi:MAG: nucleoside 2-deoxyribosyltransferase [Anaerolineae bacterium]|nr:nucleoside 2-deoxyribosyltransferase [Anaerolineae bacterium]
MAKPYVYVAGPLFNTHERGYIEQIAAALEAAGYECFVPHRDNLKTPPPGETQDQRFMRVFHADLGAMQRADFATALLTGQDVDSGTAAEVGWLAAMGKPVYGISDDRRGPVNIMIWGFCNEGWYMARSIDELIALVKKHSPVE